MALTKIVRLGRKVVLEVVRQVDFGFYLDGLDLDDVLLPNRAIIGDAPEIGDEVEVFLYLDSEDRPVATMQTPLVQSGEFAFLKVVEVNKIGAFLDWGLDKHLLAPFAEQHVKMQPGKKYLVYVRQNPYDHRLVASSKYNKFIDGENHHRLKPREEVDIIIESETDLGRKAIVNNRWWGLLYKNELFEELSFGQSRKAWVQRVRNDGKIDLTLNPGKAGHDKSCELILAALREHGGRLDLHDKSQPEEIKKRLGISKGAFKKAVGTLLKKNVIDRKSVV